jgi:hypothetical protein
VEIQPLTIYLRTAQKSARIPQAVSKDRRNTCRPRIFVHANDSHEQTQAFF